MMHNNSTKPVVDFQSCIEDCKGRLTRDYAMIESKKDDIYEGCSDVIRKPGNLNSLITRAMIMKKQHVTIFDECSLSAQSIDFIHFFTSPWKGYPSLYSLLYERLSPKDFIIYMDQISDEDINHVVVKIVWHSPYANSLAQNQLISFPMIGSGGGGGDPQQIYSSDSDDVSPSSSSSSIANNSKERAFARKDDIVNAYI